MRKPSHARARSGFSLLELIGVLAVMAVLAASVIPFLILSIDRAIDEKETADLNAFETALQQSTVRNGLITNWANLSAQIAAELGVESTSVSTNARHQTRYFLTDPTMQIGANGRGLPYVQTDIGSSVTNASGIIAPVNPRIMIVTSLGLPLVGMASGPPAVPSDFAAIWDSADGVIPAPLSGWRGKASDLKIKRMNLSGLFVRLVLAKSGTTGPCKYSVTSANYSVASPVPAETVEGFFLKDSVLLLYNGDGSLDSKQVLLKDCSFVYDQSVWRGSLDANLIVSQLDLRSIANQFLGAYPDPTATSTSSSVVQSMIAYFNAYNAWATPPSSFSDAALKSAFTSAQATLNNTLKGYYGNSHSPSEVACP